MGPDLFATHALPAEGEIIVGRAADADVRLYDPLASRRHARLRLGASIEVEDLGGANGTRLRDERLGARVPARLLPGEAVAIGSTILMVQHNRPEPAARRVLPHGEFEGRVEWECARAEATGGAFSVLRLRVPRADPQLAAGVLAAALRPMDALGCYGPGEYEALLPGLGAEPAAAVAAAARHAFERAGTRAQASVATYPRDGKHAGALLARACASLQPRENSDPDPPVFEDPVMRRLFDLAERAAAGSINVLVLGETGVGKEILARTVHRLSPRADKPFVCVDCAALSEALLESELFGHERGAFTGAAQAKNGLLETAPGGTVFLDEVGDLPLRLQAKLLRVIETRELLRVGGVKPRRIDVRFIAATNRDLEADVAAGSYRRDLYFRLNGMTLAIPPLRDRPADIEPLCRAFLAQICRSSGRRKPPALTPEALAVLRGHPWPGNVRELRNAIERALLLAAGAAIGPEHLSIASAGPGSASEQERVVAALAACGGNQSRAARRLGISRKALIARLDAYGVVRPRKDRDSPR